MPSNIQRNPHKYDLTGKSSTINLSVRLMTMALVSVGTYRRAKHKVSTRH